MKMTLILFSVLILSSCSRQRTFNNLKETHPSSFGEVYDRNGELLHEKRIDLRVNRRSWVKLQELPESMVDELIQLEDQRFRSHRGVDPLAALRALQDYPSRGASTISMQLVKLLEHRKHERSLWAKVLQAFKAIQLEFNFSKDEILESYLNLIPLAGEIQGVHAGSMNFFGKHPRGLTLEERIIIYSMIPSPNQSPEKLKQRACRYYHKLKGGPCGPIEVALSASFIRRPRTNLLDEIAPHLGHQAVKQGTPFRTTLDKNLQMEVLKTLKGHIRELQHQNVKDGAVLIIERNTSDVLAYVGSSGEYSSSPHVDHVEALRQAGSTLKPFLFAAAIGKRIITSSTLLKDAPMTITRDGLTYQPENYQKSFTMKDVPARVALGSSLNIPAIRVIDLLTPERFYSLLVSLRMRHLREEEHYGHSMALGAVDVTLWDLVRSYRTLAEGGEFKEPNWGAGKEDYSSNVPEITPETSYILSSILAEKENRYLTFGIQSSLSTDSWAAVKTGTSKDMRDNWCVGYTDTYVIGVWIGNSSGDPMWNVTGISGAAPIYNHLVTYLHKNKPSMAPAMPTGLVKVGNDIYLKGTEPRNRSLQPVARSLVTKILFPQHGSQFAYDPEIPGSHQRLFFQKSGPGGAFRLNGKELTAKELKNGFLPDKKGKYELELWEGRHLKHSVSFHVKAGRIL